MAKILDYFNESPTSFDEEYLFAVLKFKLSNLEYYIVYNRLLTNNLVALANLASTLGMSMKGITKLEETITKKSQCIWQQKEVYNEALQEVMRLPYIVNTSPVTPDMVLVTLFLKPILTTIESELLSYLFFDNKKYSKEEIAYKLNINLEEFELLYEEVDKKLSKALASNEYEEYKKRMLEFYHQNILNDNVTSQIDGNALATKYLFLNPLVLDNLISIAGIPVSDNLLEIMHRFPSWDGTSYLEASELEQDLNLEVLGYAPKYNFLSPECLYPIFLKHKDELKEEEIAYLECFFFKTRPEEEFSYDTNRVYRHTYAVERLERFYFGLEEPEFNRGKYLVVRKLYLDKITPERIKLMDLYFGVNTKRHTVGEMAELLGIPNRKVIDPLFDAIDQAKKLFIQKNQGIVVNKSLYIPYLEGNKCHLQPETLTIMHEYLVEEKDYNEISKRTSLTTVRISNIITDALRKIDFYRLGIIKDFQVSEEELEAFIAYSKDRYRHYEIQALHLKFIEKLNNDEIAEQIPEMHKQYVNSLMQDFYKEYFNYQIRDVTLTDEDYIAEHNAHPSESPLNPDERTYLEYAFIDHLSKEQIRKIMVLSSNQLFKLNQNVENKLKGKKIGILMPDLLFIPRKEFEELLKDPHLPISAKEKEIICYLFELENFPYHPLEDLVKIYNNDKNNIRRRYYRAIVSIKKYQLGEIDGKIDFQTDVEPNLKYFGIYDRNFLIDYYQNGMIYKEIAKKYNLTFNQVVSIMDHLNYTLICLINNIDIPKFDYDYYMSVINNPDLPFYGDIQMAKKAFDLVNGMDGVAKLTTPEIVKQGFPIKETAISRLIDHLMVTIMKYRMGIRKEKEFSINQVAKYYDKHKEEMNPRRKVIYTRHLNRVPEAILYKSRSNKELLFDLVKAYLPEYIKLDTLKPKKAVAIIKSASLSDKTAISLMHYFNIAPLDIIDSTSKDALVEFLNILDLKLIMLNDTSRNTEQKLTREKE